MTAALRLLLDGDALVANWRWLAAQQPGAACGAAVKADGYGLGAKDVVERLAAAGCRDFFVATWDEARALGRLPAGQLSVLHGVRAEDMPAALGGGARPVLNSVEQVQRWREAGGGACDVMVDTGMNRLGLTPAEAGSGLLDGLPIETLLSHLACADEPGRALNSRQLRDFRAVVAAVPAKRASLANSAGILLGSHYAFGLTRPGLALYGGQPVPEAAILPVVSPAAQVLQVREVSVGATVGYGATWTPARASRVAILNLGYADGLFRKLGPHLTTVDDIPVVGRISMDLVAIDVTDSGAWEGDWIAFRYDLPRLAAATGLSQYELLTGLGSRFERVWR
jgi:alanine racemase